MSLLVVIVSWNTKKLLAQCLDALCQAYEELPGIKVIVVDNFSCDGSVEMVERDYNWVKIIKNSTNYGFAKANNIAIETDSSDFVLLLNSDALINIDTIDQMINCMANNSSIGIIGATLLNPDGTFQASYASFPKVASLLSSAFGISRFWENKHQPKESYSDILDPIFVDWVGGACMMVRRQAINEVGFLDDGYFMYAEEMDWCYRFKKCGWEVVCLPQATCIHWGGQSSKLVHLDLLLRLTKSQLRFVKKHYGFWSAFLFRIGIFGGGLIKAIVFGLLRFIKPTQSSYYKDKIIANLRMAFQ